MITEAILNAFSSLIGFLLDLLPDVPGFPTAISEGMTYFVNLATGAVGLVAYLFTPVLTIFVFTAILVILNFDNVYKLVMWFWHKVRGG